MTVYPTNGLARWHQLWPVKTEANYQILIVNLMPTKQVTELQFLNLLAHTNLNCQVTFAYPSSHHFKNTDASLIKQTYQPLSQIWGRSFDALIVTGAPVEKLPFFAVDYWHEFCHLVQWSQTHCERVIFECWATLAALYVQYRIPKTTCSQKLFGIYQGVCATSNPLLQGLKALPMPQSRHSKLLLPTVLPADLHVIASHPQLVAMVLASHNNHTVYITGHPEYSTMTLDQEYWRDQAQHQSILPPTNYYQHHQIINTWQTASQTLYRNWLQI